MCGADTERVDLEAVARAREVLVRVAPLDGFEGAAMVMGGQIGILLKEGQNPHRHRFTFAHELGHAFLPQHHRQLADSGFLDEEVRDDEALPRVEREANEFAIEFLAPRDKVQRRIISGSLDVSKAAELSEAFDISLTAAALRLTNVARDPVAVLVFNGGRVEWSRRSDRFPFGIPGRGAPPPAASTVADLLNGGEPAMTAVEADPIAWLPARQWGPFPPIHESALALGATGRILVVLWSPQ